MNQFVHMADYRQHRRNTYFTRHELGQILNVYSRRVATGEWRDYAIDHDGVTAIFSIFRHTHETPLFAIAKCNRGPQRPVEYVLFNGPRKLKHAGTLAEVLEMFDRKLKLVP
ncbi:MAG: DUF2794 domain-containing protein [Alphaproteobacteria bacterium]|nr:DUF2794 domain-containing protein [Alphaproteobacteria bacterium]MBU0796976.1 DUF2794 domain-containing protein [Alphaproteobacteria bacterium]MBU0888351.1 DUF2794 domain-containing protein [Alphaproteobacteria bacterium]MBU1814662.1 DUF2794 domain-containing protein [Alphaproteobacteria bacterium]MBU2091991.1 DUF2794 domain-containing protein [Alphaproteobacteria bacterium]